MKKTLRVIYPVFMSLYLYFLMPDAGNDMKNCSISMELQSISNI